MDQIITMQKINELDVKPIPNPDLEGKKIKGEKMFKDIYTNIYLCARKKSGKTSALFKILRECAGKETNIVVFCSTLNKDHNYKHMKKYFKEKEITWIGYTSLNDDGEDRLSELVKHIQKEADDREKEEEDDDEDVAPTPMISLFDEEEEDKPKKKRKSKYLAPEWIFVFDDLSSELKSKSLLSLLKMNRHFRAKIIMSSQYLNDLLPESRLQIDVWILFKGHSDDKLAEVYKNADLSIDFNLFKQLYLKATERDYSFFYADSRNDQYRRNFNTIFMLPK